MKCYLCHGPIRIRHLYYDHAKQEALKLCSSRCMDLWTMAWPDQEAYVTATDFEAIEAALPDVGAVVAEIGMQKAVADYTKDEILRLMFSTVQAVQKHRMEIISREEIPF